jgi:cytoskeleton protein RodZ
VFEIGSSLAERRRVRGLTLEQVEAETQIPAKYLRALEDERFDSFPARVYAKSFLRLYTDYLGLATELYLEEFESRYPLVEEPLFGETEATRARRKAQRRRIALLSLAGLVAAGLVTAIGLQLQGGGSQPAAIGPVIRQPPPAPTAPSPATAGLKEEQAKPKPQLVTLRLTATGGECWIAAHRRSEQGPRLYMGTLRQGESIRLRAKRLWLRLGAPWNIEMRANGKVIRDLPVQPVTLLASTGGVRLLER